MNKNEFLEKLNWETNERGKKRVISDVTIKLSKDLKSVYFTFRNDSAQKISTCDSFVFAPFKNRLIFADGLNKNGFVMTKQNELSRRYSKVSICGREYLKYFVGDYTLKTDEFYEIMYIEKMQK